MKIVIDIPEKIYKASQIIDAKYEDVIQIPLEVIKNGTLHETVTEFADRCRECGKMRKGYWIIKENGHVKCSKCLIVHSYPSIFCPSCGAKMIRKVREHE